MSACPECAAEVTIQEAVLVSEVVVCPACEAELEVIDVDPVLLALAPEVEEDWGE
ncbi:MAG TPA: lysine biosynthesis protein LysW [Candidatus Dormibacteraeota bacterium]|nr:lysine biosynthesis protein LysW [Candidatus Dormibacteraeota bacterium]